MKSTTAGQDVGSRRRLLLVRHVKSAWDDPTIADHDRPLAARGVSALPLLQDYLLGSRLSIDLVYCSSSLRTVETLAGIRRSVPQHANVTIDRALYRATATGLLQVLRSTPAKSLSAMVVGHNPALQDLAVLLVGQGDPRNLVQLEAKLPTGAVVDLSFESGWDVLGEAVAHLEDLFLPRPSRS